MEIYEAKEKLLNSLSELDFDVLIAEESGLLKKVTRLAISSGRISL